MGRFVIQNEHYNTIIVNGYAYPSIGANVLQAWLPDLTFVSTFSYGITPNGGLIQLEDEMVINTAYDNGVRGLMVLTAMDENGVFNSELVRELLANDKEQEILIDNILANIKAKRLFGIDFDFEYVFPENRDQYVALVERTTERLNEQGYLVTVALAPKTSTDQQGLLYEGHNYQGMGQAANLCLIMTYEWGFGGGPAMAVAPLNKVREVLDYGVSQIPHNKILMGIPNYGYDWTLPFVAGSRAERISIEEAVLRAERVGAQIQFDETAQSPYYKYIDTEGREHEVWFEDPRSIKAKLNLVAEYDLAGVSFWNIMEYYAANNAQIQERFRVAKV